MGRAEDAVQERCEAAHKLLNVLRLQEAKEPITDLGAQMRLAYKPIIGDGLSDILEKFNETDK